MNVYDILVLGGDLQEYYFLITYVQYANSVTIIPLPRFVVCKQDYSKLMDQL